MPAGKSSSVADRIFSVPRSQGSIGKPSVCMMISEKGGGGGDMYILSGQYYCMRDDHSNGGNMAFADGHVEWSRFEKGPIGHGWAAPNAGYGLAHPPWKFIGEWR
jgi:prepilin-type processing-associated H-X9-DG protein